MKRINDDPYYPDFSDLDEALAKAAKRRPQKPSHREMRLMEKLPAMIDQLRTKSRTVPRPQRGRPSEFPTASFLAFILVNNEMRVYRSTFGVKNVPETETAKFIGYAMRIYPKASDDRIREHLNKSQKMLPKRVKSDT